MTSLQPFTEKRTALYKMLNEEKGVSLEKLIEVAERYQSFYEKNYKYSGIDYDTFEHEWITESQKLMSEAGSNIEKVSEGMEVFRVLWEAKHGVRS